MSPRRAQTWRGWAGRLAVLAAAALLGALVVRGLLGPSPGRDWAGELERTRGLAVDAVRWHAAERTLGAARGRLWFTATAADDHHTDLWTGEAWQSPGGSPLWLGPVRRVTATPAGDERLLAADPERAVVRVGTLLRTVDASGRVLDLWRLEVPIEALRLVPELQAQREGRWGPLSEVAAPIRPIGPPPSEPIGRLTASPPPEGAPRPARWPPRAPWSALAESDGAAQRWDAGPVTVFAFHPQRFRAEYVWGAAGPVADDGQVGPGRPVEPAAVRITLSADAIGDAGLQLPEVAVRPLMRGAATLALDAEGRAGFALWDGETPRTGLPWSTVLQRPWPLVVEGRVMPGQPRGDAAAALGVAGDGTWLYAAAQGEAGVALLGPTLQAAGAELALTVAREAAVAWHPKGVGGEFQAWLGDGAHRAADRAVAAGYLALRARPPRVLAPGWTPMGDEARPTWAARRQGGLLAWRLDDDHWRPSTQPEGLWWPHGPDAVPGVDGLRRDGATLRPMRARALTL
ncbi:MAG: hypothetical protein KC613_19185, partial [Myxococcales bacterium]|nr:hypothetical protein [Myxococcales bacterium]